VPVANGFEIIQVDEIMYIRAEGSYSKIQDKHGQEVTISHNLKYFEVLLSADKNSSGFIAAILPILILQKNYPQRWKFSHHGR